MIGEKFHFLSNLFCRTLLRVSDLSPQSVNLGVQCPVSSSIRRKLSRGVIRVVCLASPDHLQSLLDQGIVSRN